MIRARRIGCAYDADRPVLDGLDLDVAPGEILALVGPNGAGKTTLLRLLAGTLAPLRGTLELPPRRSADGRVRVGYAPEEEAHFRELSGTHNALFFARAAGLGRRAARSAVAACVARLGLADDRDRPVSTYSFGMRRKLALVEAFAHDPALLLLDEPSVGLDARSRDALVGLLRERSSAGAAAVLASHDLDFVTRAADRVAFLHRGRIVGGGAPEDLVARVGGGLRIEVVTDRAATRFPVRWGERIRVVRDGDPLVIETDRGHDAVADVCSALTGAGATLRSLRIREVGLAEAYRRAAGVELGDGGPRRRS